MLQDLSRVGSSVAGGRDHARRGSRSSRARLLAPVAAAAAVAGIVAAALLVPHHPTHAAATGSGQPAGPGYAEGGRVPPYFVALTWSNNTRPSDAAVQLTATGATIATVKHEAGYNIVGVTGAADDRTFILGERSLKQQPNQVPSAESHSFYRLRISASGRPSSVTPLPITEPNGILVMGFALSPDGTKLAVALYPGNGQSAISELKIYSIATGAVLRTWSAFGSIGSSPDDAEQLSWFSDQTIGFTWLGNINGPDQGEWLLDLGLTGNSLLADSRQAMSLGYNSSQQAPSGPVCQESIVTPNGSAVVCAAVNIADNSDPVSEYAFLVYPTATGMPIRTLAHGTIKNEARSFADLLWSNPTGSVLIGVIPTSSGSTDSEVVMVTAGTFIPLPGGKLGEANDASMAWLYGRRG